MPSILKRIGLVLILAAGLGLTASACWVEPEIASGPGAHLATPYYTPLYYNGYVVYYDGWGRPTYYSGGNRYYVPQSTMYYNRYLTHYRTYRPYYRRWYQYRGYRYRGYRRPTVYRRGRRGYRYRRQNRRGGGTIRRRSLGRRRTRHY